MDHLRSSTTRRTMSRADKIRDWAKTLAVALLVIPFPTALIWAAFNMPAGAW